MGLYLGRQKIENIGETFGLSVALSNYVEGTRLSYVAVQEKGGMLPQEQTIGNLPDSIRTIETGIFPSGKKIITNTQEANVSNFATAQVQDSNLVASNIKKSVSILGITGSYEGGSGGIYNEVPSYQVDANGNATRRSGNLDGKFDNIRSIGSDGMSHCFYSCSNISSVSFPSLTSIGTNGMYYCFSNCSNLSSVSFPSLTSIDSYGMYYCFSNCSKLSSVSFTELKNLQASTSLNNLGSSSSLKEIHFRTDMQTAVEAQSQYSSKFGASNATIYFDL